MTASTRSWHENWWLRQVVGGLGEAAWEAGPQTVVDVLTLADWLTGGDGSAIEPLNSLVEGWHDDLEDRWGTDTDSTAYQAALWGARIGSAAAGGYGIARALVHGAARFFATRAGALADLLGRVQSAWRHALENFRKIWHAPDEKVLDDGVPAPPRAVELDADDFPAYGKGYAFEFEALGEHYAPGLRDPEKRFGSQETPVAEWILENDPRALLHPRQNKNGPTGVQVSDAMLRRTADDVGVQAEFKRVLTAGKDVTATVRRSIESAGDQLAANGDIPPRMGPDGLPTGEAYIDCREVGLTRAQAETAIRRTGGALRSKPDRIPDVIHIILGDGSEYLATRSEVLAGS